MPTEAPRTAARILQDQIDTANEKIAALTENQKILTQVLMELIARQK